MTPADLREAREAAGLSQEALGDLIGRTTSVVAKYESGARTIPLEMRRKLRDVLDGMTRTTPEGVAALKAEQGRLRKMMARLDARIRALNNQRAQGTAGEDGEG